MLAGETENRSNMLASISGTPDLIDKLERHNGGCWGML